MIKTAEHADPGMLKPSPVKNAPEHGLQEYSSFTEKS